MNFIPLTPEDGDAASLLKSFGNFPFSFVSYYSDAKI